MEHQTWTRREFLRLASTGVALTAFGINTVGERLEHGSQLSFSQTDLLAELFKNPPDEARPRCYWYWMNGNITREGILADLEGMAEIGVSGVNYFDIALLPDGHVVNRSREWFDLVGYAIEEAAKRNIKVSFNCPGWSGTGGPWITPEYAMQELTWSEISVEGGQNFSSILPQPPTRLDYYRDIAILAFPTPYGDKPLPLPQAIDSDGNPLPHAISALTHRTVLADHRMSQSPAVSDGPFMQEDLESVKLPATFDLVFPKEVEVRSVYAHATRKNGSFQAQILAWDETTAKFNPVAQMNSRSAGPFSDQLASACFPSVKATKFRMIFENSRRGQNIQLEKLMFSGGFRVTNWPVKTGFSSEQVNPSANDVITKEGDIIQRDKVIDLTDLMDAEGKINWKAPQDGNWTILRIGHTPTGVYLFPTAVGGVGLDCDKMSREAADFHYDHCVKPILNEFGRNLIGKPMTFYHMDSYESGWQNWTAKFPEDFRKRRGYDILKYMPALTGRVVENLETTERFLWDFRRTIGDLFADNNYGRLAERCHKDGIQFSTEPYGGPFEHLQVGIRADHPMTEIWIQRPTTGKKVWFQAVQSGRTAGKKIIGAETFTCNPPYGGDWKDHPFSIKALGDFIFCCGVNQHCFHVSTHQPLLGDHMKPGFTCGMNGIHFDRGETWWSHGGKEWVTYISRCQALLQAGEHVADVLYFQGNDSPYGVFPFESELPDGYDFDACGSEILEDAGVQNGKVVLKSGKKYRYLAIPRHGHLTLASLRKIVSLAKQGARVVGVIPNQSPSLSDVSNRVVYERLKQELANYIEILPINQVFSKDQFPPDFSYDENDGMVLHTIHRELGDADCYFVANANFDKKGIVSCSFRVIGKIPELYHADTGLIEPCAVYRFSGSTTQIPLYFDPSGSVFVVFRSGDPKPHAISVSHINTNATPAALATIPLTSLCNTVRHDGKKLVLNALQAGQYCISLSNEEKERRFTVSAVPDPVVINTPWTVRFPSGWGAPENITLDKLISWPEHSDAGVQFFSGTAIYKTTFRTIKVAPRCRLFLDLGRVEVIAELWLNGHFLGTLWKPPFVYEITGLLRPKVNDLEVHITNLWPNRLIGDEQFPDDCTGDGRWKSGVIPSWPEWLIKRQPRPEFRRLTFCTWKHWRKDDPLLPSGLLGPVTLRQVKIINI